MLHMLGTLTVDTRPFSIDAMERSADASIVAKPVIGAAPPKEFTGDGEDDITISGQILPLRIGGLNQLELAHQTILHDSEHPSCVVLPIVPAR